MDAYLVLISDQPMGDALMAMWAAQVIALEAAKENRAFFLNTKNKEVEVLLRPKNALTMRALPGRSNLEVFRLDMGYILGEMGRSMHPVDAYLKQSLATPYGADGRPLTVTTLPEPYTHMVPMLDHSTGKVGFPPIPDVDFLIHPFSNGNPDIRMMPLENWNRVFDLILDKHPEAEIGILGGHMEPRPWPSMRRQRPCIKYLYGLHLNNVIRLIQSAHCIATVDSGMNRLSHIVGHTNHVILCPVEYPEFWVTHPGARVVIGTPKTWDPDEIAASMLQELEQKKAAC